MSKTPVFSDRIEHAITSSRTVLVAGIDPDIETIPAVFLDDAAAHSSTDEDFFCRVISGFYLPALERIASKIASVKPNLAFFEQYGIGGLRAYKEICQSCQKLHIPVIADAKRGDIGSTATAYANAFFGPRSAASRAIDALYADALTVNPFLGFDTLEPFLNRARETGSGIFVLVRTSNPGSADLQGITGTDRNGDISQRIAEWVAERGATLMGESGVSGLGAVVGATHEGELARLRALMPDTLFLVPGYGAQGGSAEAIAPGTMSAGKGVIVNSSRGIFGGLARDAGQQEVLTLIERRVTESNQALGCVRQFQ